MSGFRCSFKHHKITKTWTCTQDDKNLHSAVPLLMQHDLSVLCNNGSIGISISSLNVRAKSVPLKGDCVKEKPCGRNSHEVEDKAVQCVCEAYESTLGVTMIKKKKRHSEKH